MTDQLAADGYPMTMRKADLCQLLNISEATFYRRLKAHALPVPRGGWDTRAKARHEWRRPEVANWYFYAKPAKPARSLQAVG